MAQSVKNLTFGFSADHDLMGHRTQLCFGLPTL